ncbi:MAG: ferrochelatase [Weeksellaceae bacterium]|jgi:ferrochelatase|nr:ferrochelatase [Weeksellaceae bacterium]
MKKGVLLLNWGAADSSEKEEVKEFLKEVLMDPMVLDFPFLTRKFLADFKIIPQKLNEITEAYKKTEWTEGSPLSVISKRLQKKTQQKTQLPTATGMRYGSPSIQHALYKLASEEVEQILVIPLFPQYTMSSTWTAVDKVMEIQQKKFKNLQLTFLNSFYKHPDYIQALADRIMGKLPSEYDKLVFSYRGIPERHERKASEKAKQYKFTQFETYKNQCITTTELVCKEVGIDSEKVEITFHTPLGKGEWLKPSTMETLENYPKIGIKKVVVISPSHVLDSTETLENISTRGLETFKSAGGDYFGYIKGLNDNEEWAKTLAKWINDWAKREEEKTNEI